MRGSGDEGEAAGGSEAEGARQGGGGGQREQVQSKRGETVLKGERDAKQEERCVGRRAGGGRGRSGGAAARRCHQPAAGEHSIHVHIHLMSREHRMFMAASSVTRNLKT